MLHENMDSFTKFYGTCGSFYILEQVQPYSEYFPEIIPNLKWRERVKVAKSFLKLLKEFQNSIAGPLSHCDIQEANFGLTKEMEVKAIDVDLVYAQERMEDLLSQPKCSSNKDCDFFDCMAKCNIAAEKCTSIPLSNNLQVYQSPTGNYMFKVNNRYTRARCEICAKLTIKTLYC